MDIELHTKRCKKCDVKVNYRRRADVQYCDAHLRNKKSRRVEHSKLCVRCLNSISHKRLNAKYCNDCRVQVDRLHQANWHKRNNQGVKSP